MTAATFAPNPRRRAMLAKVHLAKKELGLIDDDYRAIIFEVAGKTSAGDCSTRDLEQLLDRFKQRGFNPVARGPAKARRNARPADTPLAMKARAMWISLHYLDLVENPSDEALEAFARRQLGCARMQWADQGQGYKLVEALKAMATRAGWKQDDLPVSGPDKVHVLKRRLCDLLLSRLQRVTVVPRTWSLDDAAFRLLGMKRPASDLGTPLPWALGDLDVIAKGLGEKLKAWRS